ncbi:protein ANTI-SILENCING 1-like [Henckelia pumila]|uniref:protein ANTI-SILENCING 1-like n=1 Tax=Henckelia pumila TaxID=405737 RepID=UPI003C6E8C01
MSHLEGDGLEEPEFKWLKERVDIPRHKAPYFYESFLYEGVEYSLYDSVYLQVEPEQPNNNIGRIVGIWEEANNSKKIRVQWFFRPSEIFYYLGDTEVLDNELFLASGQGIGLMNICPLEAIVGKCNVVCTSTDGRNPQPSENERNMAEYVFYRVFDVQSFLISDQFNATVGVLQVEFVFNKKQILRTLSSSKFELHEHDARSANAFKGTTRFVCANSPNKSLHSNGDCNHMLGNDDTNEKQVDIAKEELFGDAENRPFSKEPTSRGECSNVYENSSEERMTTSIIDNRSASSDSIVGCQANAEKDKVINKKSHFEQAQFEDNVKSMKSHGLSDTSKKRGMFNDISSKDSGKNIETSTIKSKNSLSDKNDGCQVNIESKKVKDTKFSLKNDCFGDRVQSDSKTLYLDDTFVKRGKFDVGPGEDGKATSNTSNKNVSCVKNVDHACLKKEKHKDKSSKDNGETSVRDSMISRNCSEMQVSGATSFDANLKFEIGKEDSKGPRNDVKPTKSRTILNENISDVRTSSPKTLDSEHHVGFVSHQKDLKSTKCLNASRGNPSRINDSFVDEASKNKSHEVFESPGQFASHVELSSDITNQLAHAYPPNGERNHGHDSCKRKDLSSMEGFCFVDAPSKKAKLDDHKKPSKENNMELIPKLKVKSSGVGQEMTSHAHGACEKKDLTSPKDSCVIGPSKEARLDGSSKTSTLNKNDVFQNSKKEIHHNKDGKVEGESFEVIPRPIKEKRSWLKLGNTSWESMKAAHKEGKLVLLQNLDPTLTSAEVKDIIWYAFEEKCTTKMVQHGAMSSPHNSQALLIFDTMEVAERVLKGLEDKCLMLQNHRPLVGSTVNVLLPGYPRKQTTFLGHLSVGKGRHHTQRDTKEAVSTSHYSQPNTIEYEMAMEWWLLQSKSNIWYQNLFEQHKVQLGKLGANLQVK